MVWPLKIETLKWACCQNLISLENERKQSIVFPALTGRALHPHMQKTSSYLLFVMWKAARRNLLEEILEKPEHWTFFGRIAAQDWFGVCVRWPRAAQPPAWRKTRSWCQTLRPDVINCPADQVQTVCDVKGLRKQTNCPDFQRRGAPLNVSQTLSRSITEDHWCSESGQDDSWLTSVSQWLRLFIGRRFQELDNLLSVWLQRRTSAVTKLFFSSVM